MAGEFFIGEAGDATGSGALDEERFVGEEREGALGGFEVALFGEDVEAHADLVDALRFEHQVQFLGRDGSVEGDVIERLVGERFLHGEDGGAAQEEIGIVEIVFGFLGVVEAAFGEIEVGPFSEFG